MDCYEIDGVPEHPLRVLLRAVRERVRDGLPTFASVSYNRGAREHPRVVQEKGFRTPLGERVSPASTQLRAGPIVVTVVWPRRA